MFVCNALLDVSMHRVLFSLKTLLPAIGIADAA